MNTNSTDTNFINMYNYSFLGDNRRQNISDSNINSNVISYRNTDIDNLVSQQMEKVRVKLEQKRKRETMMIIEAIEIGMMKKMKAKEQEIEKMERMNVMLEERVKTLSLENQIWREIAQNNEATANALRYNLENMHREMKNDGAAEEDAESYCENEGRKLMSCAQDKENEGRKVVLCAQDKEDGESEKKRWCRNCGERESCVLILPCRHLCLCAMCGATVHSCPICQSFKNTTLNVNFG